MSRNRQSYSICFVSVASLALAIAADAQTNLLHSDIAFARQVDNVQTTDLQPFSNRAYIPVTADLSSITFERARLRMVPTKRTSSYDQAYCGGLREPGGSMFCPAIQDGSTMPAYEVTYSFQGQPIASDETGTANFTFSVYFHPEELSPALREQISRGKLKRSTSETFFALSSHAEEAQVQMVDEANSSFCEVNLAEGPLTHADSKCQDKIAYKKAPANYVTVQINPVEQRMAAVSR